MTLHNTNKRVALSNLVANQLPEFVRAQYPAFVAFLEAYYEYLENNSVDLTQIRDIDTTLDEFIQYFKSELAHNYPISNSFDTERYLLKHVKDQYLAKGSEASYKLLFRLLFSKDVYLDYPGRQMLRISDGRWQQDVSLFVRVDLGDPISLIGKIVDIQTSRRLNIDKAVSKVTANVENVIKVSDNIYELFLDRKFYGDIQPGDSIKYQSTFQGQILPCTSKIKVQKKGTKFKPGQVFQIQFGEGSPLWFKILTTDENGGIEKVDIIKFGIGYDTDFSMEMLPTSAVTTQKKVEKSVIALTLSIIDGVIGSISVLNGGSGYQFPPDIRFSDEGTGAQAHAIIEDGKVVDIVIDNGGSGYTQESFIIIAPKPNDLTGAGAKGELTLGTNYDYVQADTVQGFTEVGYGNWGDYWDLGESGRGAKASAIVHNDVITKINVTNQGNNYTTAVVNITDSIGSGTSASAVIEDGKITSIVINNYGFNYTNPTISIVGDGTGATASAVIEDGAITNLSLITGGSNYNYPSPYVDICHPLDFNGIPLGNGRKATARAAVENGIITGLIITDPGKGYNNIKAPQVTITGAYGYANGAYVGSIARQFYVDAKDTISDNQALLNVSLDAVARYPGYYKTNDGFLNDSMFIQDSFYYQAFSYVIRIDEQLQSYAAVTRTMLHPSGMAMFGEYSINNKFDLSIALQSLVKSLGVTLYDIATIDDSIIFDERNRQINGLSLLFSKDLSSINIYPIDAINYINTYKSLDDSFTQSDSLVKAFEKAIGYTGSTEKIFAIDDGSFRRTTKVFADSTSLTETYLRHLTTKNVNDYITPREQYALYFTLNTILDPLSGIYPEEGYVVFNPYDEGSFFAEHYANDRPSSWSN